VHRSLSARFAGPTWRRLLGLADSYASLLALLLLNFFMLELIDDPRWGAIVSTLLGAAALVVAISDPDAGETVTRTQVILIVACVLLAPIVLLQEGPHQQAEYVYHSFVTLTTLGFGDLSPSVGLPQAPTALEALLGQVFLVTLVARLVTLWGLRAGRGAAMDAEAES
jgi:hypothetical protein